MAKIAELKKSKEKDAKKRYQPLQTDPSKPPANPIDFLKDVDFRRNVTSSFKTTTRKQYE